MIDRRKLLTRLALLVAFIFFVNFGAITFHWYSSLWGLDMFVHFLGGLWLSLFLLWFLNREKLSRPVFFYVTILVLLVGVLWEAYEILVNEYIASIIFDYQDSVSDVFFDLSGGFAGLVYFYTRIMKKSTHLV